MAPKRTRKAAAPAPLEVWKFGGASVASADEIQESVRR